MIIFFLNWLILSKKDTKNKKSSVFLIKNLELSSQYIAVVLQQGGQMKPFTK